MSDSAQSPGSKVAGLDGGLMGNGVIDRSELSALASMQPVAGKQSRKAGKEEKDIYAGKDKKRANRLKEVVSIVVNFGLGLMALLFFAVVALRVWHMLAPGWMMWISAEKLVEIDHLIVVVTTGAVATFASTYFKAIFGFSANGSENTVRH